MINIPERRESQRDKLMITLAFPQMSLIMEGNSKDLRAKVPSTEMDHAGHTGESGHRG